MIIGILILFGLYFLSMLTLMIGFSKVSIFSSKVSSQLTRFSVVIPFRNESENLPVLLESISKLDYGPDLFEIIFVNDFSEDNSEEIILQFQETTDFSIRLIQNKHISNSPKKDAISEAIKKANHEWIVTTDADCKLPKNWLKSLDSFIQSEECQKNNPVMVCGPVVYKTDETVLQNYQYFDGLSLQAVTIGSFGLKNPLLCNGANLAYRKDAFEKVNGFFGNNHIASGDDIFLMETLKKSFPGKVKFLKSRDFIVKTKPQLTWKSVINQRVRWASKTSQQNNLVSVVLGVLVFVINLIFLLLPIILIFNMESWFAFFLFIIFKIVLDFVVIKRVDEFFQIRSPIWKFVFMPFFYAGITVWVVLKSFRGSYFWKDREFSIPIKNNTRI